MNLLKINNATAGNEIKSYVECFISNLYYL